MGLLPPPLPPAACSPSKGSFRNRSTSCHSSDPHPLPYTSSGHTSFLDVPAMKQVGFGFRPPPFLPASSLFTDVGKAHSLNSLRSLRGPLTRPERPSEPATRLLALTPTRHRASPACWAFQRTALPWLLVGTPKGGRGRGPRPGRQAERRSQALCLSLQPVLLTIGASPLRPQVPRTAPTSGVPGPARQASHGASVHQVTRHLGSRDTQSVQLLLSPWLPCCLL